MKTLFKQFTDKPTTNKSNNKHLEDFRTSACNVEAEIIFKALKTVQDHWVKIRLLHSGELRSVKMPGGTKRRSCICLYVVVNSFAPIKLMSRIKDNSRYFEWKSTQNNKKIHIISLIQV